MENASKALLIAAAVLVVIILVAVGMKIYSSTTGTQKVATDTGKTISDKTKDTTDIAISQITGKKNVINYGTKTKETIQPGDDITIGTEKFKVFSKTSTEIKAMPYYNITLTDKPVQSQSAGIIEFSQTNFWAKGEDIKMDEKKEDGSYKNNIQQYINEYRVTLEKLGVDGITVRAAIYSELDVGGVTKVMRNPGKSGDFWLSSSHPSLTDYVWFVARDGSYTNSSSYNYSRGVRPIIIIH